MSVSAQVPVATIEPDRCALETRLNSVLAFSTRHSARISEYGDLWADEIDPFVSLADKVIVEGSLLTLIASRIESPSVRNHVQSLAEVLAPLARSSRNKSMLLRFPHTASSLGMAHVALSAAGSVDRDFDALLAGAFASGRVHASERPSFRAMELRWLLSLYQDRDPAYRDFLSSSILSTKAHPIYMSSPEAYALTHAVMYLTDFGQKPPPAELDTSDCARLLEAAIAWHLVGENLDLLAESLLAMVSLKVGGSYAKLAWSALSWAWEAFGFLPSPSFEPQDFAALEGDQAQAYAFRHVYHTEYVGGILCAVLLSAGAVQEGVLVPPPLDNAQLAKRCRRSVARSRAYWSDRGERASDVETAQLSPSVPPVPDALRLATTRLAESRTAGSRENPLWREACTRTELARNEVAQVLLDGLLIHAAREYELATLASTLADICRLRLPLTTTVLEAIEFLLGQQLPNGAIGAQFLSQVPSRAVRDLDAVAALIEEGLAEVSASLVSDEALS